MTPHPVDETKVKDEGKKGGEVPASREKDGGSRDSELPSAPPDTSKCWSVGVTPEKNLDN